MTTKTDHLLSVEDLAARLRTEVRFVRRLVSERRISFTKVGKFVRFYPEDVEAFIAAGRVEAITVSWSGGRAGF
ncbi:helix-turn-helix domain-containing protein [Longispora sp. NPDC051575]|uniref:helix-turn-helix domain-containing protein n=1 Tax=Longispora sp. NPDC051575 TaxID=3154943 RepID=UPI003426595C